MEKKSFMKKLTGSREALLAVILVLLFVVITIISQKGAERKEKGN